MSAPGSLPNTSDLLSIKTIWMCQACGALALSVLGDEAAARVMRAASCGECGAGRYADVGMAMPLIRERWAGDE